MRQLQCIASAIEKALHGSSTPMSKSLRPDPWHRSDYNIHALPAPLLTRRGQSAAVVRLQRRTHIEIGLIRRERASVYPNFSYSRRLGVRLPCPDLRSSRRRLSQPHQPIAQFWDTLRSGGSRSGAPRRGTSTRRVPYERRACVSATMQKANARSSREVR